MFQGFCLKIVAVRGCQKRGKKKRVKIQILDNLELSKLYISPYLVIQSELKLFMTPHSKKCCYEGSPKTEKSECMKSVKKLLSIVTDSLEYYNNDS